MSVIADTIGWDRFLIGVGGFFTILLALWLTIKWVNKEAGKSEYH